MRLSDFTSRKWSDITPWEWEYLQKMGVCNGCGGSGMSIWNRCMRWIIRWLLKRLRCTFVTADCHIHDLTYWQWILAVLNEDEIEIIKKISPRALKILEELRREECDLWFFQKIIDDIGKYQDNSMDVIKYTLLALCFYLAVRIGGKWYFNYQICSSKNAMSSTTS